MAVIPVLLVCMPVFGRGFARPYFIRQQNSPEMIKTLRRPYGPDSVLERPERDIIRLYERRTGRRLWSYSVSDVECSAWSGDGRTYALAFQPYGIEGTMEWPTWEILIWRNGEKPRIFDDRKVIDQTDGVLSMEFSPDRRRLLVRTQDSMVFGKLWCIDLRSFHVLSGPDNAYRGAHWLDNCSVRCFPSAWWTGRRSPDRPLRLTREIKVWHLPQQ